MSHRWSPEWIRRIHDAPCRVVLAVTGGGSRALAALLEVPGASRTVLEAIVPYSAASLAAWLGAPPEQHCSQHTARAMAMAAFQRALDYRPAGETDRSLAGVACTASLASDRPKRGAHRIHAALQTGAVTLVHSLELVRGRRARRQEERLAAAMVLNLVAEACGLADRLALELVDAEQLETARVEAPTAWQDLLAGRIPLASGCSCPEGDVSRQPRPANSKSRALFPGAFDPLHDGHREMARIAGRRLGAPVEFELSIANVDKPPLDFIEMHRRAAQFGPDQPLWFTRAATFVEKTGLFPGCTFIVGADTILRIADPRYYGGQQGACREAIDQIAAAGCRFLVFGRRLDGRFASLASLELPEPLLRLCDEVPSADFRKDVSSTELRRGEG